MDLSFLKQVVPTIATALGGPLAGVAAGFIADRLGVSDKTVNNINDLVTSATQKPETLIELKKIDADLKKYYDQIGVDLEKIAAQDRDSARNREIQVKDNTPKILAYSVTVGFFSILGYVIKNGLPTGNESVITYMIGSLGGVWGAIMAYYFGSTKGSSEKTAVMAATITAKEK
jgi:hypothetical protein